MTIDKRINFRLGGDTMGGINDKSVNNDGPERPGAGNNSDIPSGVEGTLADPREKMDFVGETIFGPTQKYSGDGMFSGYRNLDAFGQPKMGLSFVADRAANLFSPQNIGRGILSLVNPLAGLTYGAYNYLQNNVPQTLNTFQQSPTLMDFYNNMRTAPVNNTIDIREKFNRTGGLSGIESIQTVGSNDSNIESPLLPGAENATGLTIAELQALINNASLSNTQGSS